MAAMDRLVVALVIAAVAVAVALVARRRRQTDPPTQAAHHVPDQVDRRDFDRLVAGDPEWLVVAFTSATCHTCADMVAKAQVLAGPAVGFAEVEYGAERELHRRYAIDAVPTVVLADRAGVVLRAFQGRVSATDLWAAVAEAREPGSTPAGEHGGSCQRDSTG